ncbi:MAG: NADH-quinone oxidoreductase subunit J [Bacteroidota bacterium]
MADKLFYFLSFVAILSALMVVFSKNPIHSVLYLILTFLALTGHYFLLNAQFLAAVNLIVYMGAIMVLFLFVIMFLNMREETAGHRSFISKAAACLAGAVLLLVMVAALWDAERSSNVTAYNGQIGLVENLGKVLFNDYLLPFELASILFLSAMVGAVMLGKREEGEKNSF